MAKTKTWKKARLERKAGDVNKLINVADYNNG